MKNRAIEQTGLIPRSIIRTFERFRKQLLSGSEMLVIQEFRISRYQVIVSARCLLILIVAPIVFHTISKYCIIKPLIYYFWNQNNTEFFLNSYQQHRALIDFQAFEEKVYFESLLEKNFTQLSNDFLIKNRQEILEIATKYNLESIDALSNLFSDLVSFLSLRLLFVLLKTQIIILKAFLAESFYSLSDTIKSFLLILGTDLLVGFHSPRGWEVFLEWLFRHFGLPENIAFMSLFVATFPVFLDTVFKYWIFRSLNRISPSTVATYHRMIE